MRLLEHEGKEVLRRYGIQVPTGQLVSSPQELALPLPLVLKAQVPLGGRKKAGAILEAATKGEAKGYLERLFSLEIGGYRSLKILCEEKLEVSKEFFIAITYDTIMKRAVAIFSLQGGVEVEQLVRTRPELVSKGYFSILEGLPQYRAREIISETKISGNLLLKLGAILSRLSRIFLDTDATLVEVNPLALTPDGRLVALDCHIELDDDALFRQKTFQELAHGQKRYGGGKKESQFEQKAYQIDQLDHRGVAGRVIEFDGELGLLIGGGGASLTAFDAILQHRGRPANYCEIGGNPSVLKLKELTKHILSRPGVEKIAVIMNVVSNTRVDMVARGVIKGVLEAGQSPSETIVVFRVPGAWEEEGIKILKKYGVTFYGRDVSIDEAARIAVEKTKDSRSNGGWGRVHPS